MREPERPWSDQERTGFAVFLLSMALLTAAGLHLLISCAVWFVRHS